MPIHKVSRECRTQVELRLADQLLGRNVTRRPNLVKLGVIKVRAIPGFHCQQKKKKKKTGWIYLLVLRVVLDMLSIFNGSSSAVLPIILSLVSLSRCASAKKAYVLWSVESVVHLISDVLWARGFSAILSLSLGLCCFFFSREKKWKTRS